MKVADSFTSLPFQEPSAQLGQSGEAAAHYWPFSGNHVAYAILFRRRASADELAPSYYIYLSGDYFWVSKTLLLYMVSFSAMRLMR